MPADRPHYVQGSYTRTEAEAICFGLRRLLGLDRRAGDTQPDEDQLRAALSALDKTDSILSGRKRILNWRPPRAPACPFPEGEPPYYTVTAGRFAGFTGRLIESEGLRTWEVCLLSTVPGELAGMAVVVKRSQLRPADAADSLPPQGVTPIVDLAVEERRNSPTTQ